MLLRLAAASLLALSLTGCGSSSQEATGPTSTPTVTATALPSGSSSASMSPAATASTSASPSADVASSSSTSPSTGAIRTAPSGPLPIGATIKDHGLGHTVVLEQAVRNFPAPKAAKAPQGSELVLVQVRITAGKKYYVTAGPDDFVFGVKGGSESTPTSERAVAKAMTKAGYPPLKQVAAGSTGEGWVAGYVSPAGSPQAYVGYHRLAYQISGGGSVPAKTWKVSLPTG